MPPAGPPARPGRPRYAPNDADRAKVERMAGFGMSQPEIALVMGISAPTLRQYYADELEKGVAKANMAVAGALFRVATTSQGREAVTAQIFWLKTRAGWREAPPAEPPGKKEQRETDAATSHEGTEWEEALRQRH